MIKRVGTAVRFWLCSTVAALIGQPALAQVQPAPVSAAGKWIVDYGKDRCSLIRRVEGAEPMMMVLRTPLGSLQPELLLLNGAWKSDPLGGALNVDLVLEPSAARHTVEAVSGTTAGSKRMIAMRRLYSGFFEEYADARRLMLEVGGKKIADVALPNSRAAVAALKSCNNDLLTSWGVDVVAQAALRQTPTPIEGGGSWISDSDYPSEAMRKNQSGPVVARYTVGADGKVRECVAVVSSGAPALDARTCQALGRRKYQPAIGADGTSVAAQVIITIHWMLEDQNWSGLMTTAAPSAGLGVPAQ